MKNHPLALSLFVLTLLLSGVSVASADLRLSRVFQNHMVLQRDKPVPVWGWADAGASVTASFAGQEKSVTADDQGYWKVTFDPLAASSKGGDLKVKAGGQTLELQDILVGEVWVCAGQSNMARPLRNDNFDYPRFQDYANDAEYPSIRFINFDTAISDRPEADFDPKFHEKATWRILDSESAMFVMSIPFFFAKDLNKTLDVPIGLVQVAVSGTPQTAWMAREVIDATAGPNSESYDEYFASLEERQSKGKDEFKSWAEYAAAEKASRENPDLPRPSPGQYLSDYPSVLYNALIHPLAPMAIEGVLWHQGESGPGGDYSGRLLAQMKQWRELFGQDFSFIWGSLTRDTGTPPPLEPLLVTQRGDLDEEFLQASQASASKEKNILVNFFDLGNNSTHWGRKEEAGHRMAKAALSMADGKSETVFTGPELVEAKIEGNTVRAKFRHIGGGLDFEPSVDGISGFVLQDKDKLRWAEVVVEGDTIVLSHPDISAPINAYYGWHSNPHETLFNREGYPAYRFRVTDSGRIPKSDAGIPLVELISPAKNTKINLGHVRRHGYMFGVNAGRGGSGEAEVRVRLPSEWKDAIITVGGQPVEAGTMQTGADGYRYYEFKAVIDGSQITVADTAEPPDFSGIERF